MLLYVIEYSIESPTLVFSQQLLVADLKNSFICKKSLASFPVFNFAIFVVQPCTRDENRWEGFPVTIEAVVRITVLSHTYGKHRFSPLPAAPPPNSRAYTYMSITAS